MENSQNPSEELLIEYNDQNSSIYEMKVIQQRLANTIGRAGNVYVSPLIDKEFNNPNGKTCRVKVLVETSEQKAGLMQTLKCQYDIQKDTLKISIETIEENGFNVPPQTKGNYLKKALKGNPLVDNIEDTEFGVQLYIAPVVLQYSSTSGEDVKGFLEPKGSYLAANEFQLIMKSDIKVFSSTSKIQ